MRLSIVIVNYNVRVFLENALAALTRALEGIDGEIIVVDNASDDGSVEMLRQKFPGVSLIANTVNKGFAAGNNLALPRCRGEYILLINPDTVVQEDTLRALIGYMDEHPSVGLATCKILNPDGTLELACRRSFPTPWVAFSKIIGLSALFPHSKLFGRYNLTYKDPNAECEVDAVSGSFMFLRKTVAEQVGGLDEQFFMYGEDLDWCYRIKQAGWRVMYTPATQIIHYRGQSTKRSDIDEVRVFYDAMRVFVRKHFQRGLLFDVIVLAGIRLRQGVAFLQKNAKPIKATAVDFVIVNLSLLAGEYIWFRKVLGFPSYAYPALIIVPWLVLALVMYSFGVYTSRKYSSPRAAGAVLFGYLVLSALTFFFKQYGFSRMVVLISGALNLVLIPGWRMAARVTGGSPGQRRSLFGRRTIIVGARQSGQEVLRKLRARVDDGYEVVGFIETDRRKVGERVAGVEILGTIDNIGKVLEEFRASEVIFSTDSLTYADILSVISRSKNRSVNYRLVPNSLEVIIGKTHIDRLEDIPLVDIEYNIDRVTNRIVKRAFDLLVSGIVLCTLFPFAELERRLGNRLSVFEQRILLFPDVFRGKMSLVGPPGDAPYLGKPGITGLVQLKMGDGVGSEERESYNLYYAKNQSFILDLEILLKSFIHLVKR